MFGGNIWGELSGGESLWGGERLCGKLFGGHEGGKCLDPHVGLQSLHVTITICATLVNTHADTQTAFDWLYYYLSQLSQKSSSKIFLSVRWDHVFLAIAVAAVILFSRSNCEYRSPLTYYCIHYVNSVD